LIRAARDLAPEGMSVDLIEIGGLPFYNADLEAEGDPAAVAAFKSSVEQILGHIRARVLPPPEVLVARAHERFDRDLRLTDHGSQRVLVDLLQRFSRWIEREQAADRAVSGMDSR